MTRYIISPDNPDETTITDSDIIRSTARKTHTGMGLLRAELATTTDLLPFAKKQSRIDIEIDGVVEWIGVVVKFNKNRTDGTSELKGLGIAKRLEDGRPDYDNLSNDALVYQDIRLDDAIEDYWTRTPFTASVTTQSTEDIAEGEVLQASDSTTEFQNNVTIPDQEPFVINNGNLELAQSGFFFEAEDVGGIFTPIDQGSYVGNDNLSNAAGARLDDLQDNVNANFDLEYEIPAEEFRAQFRSYLDSADFTVEVRLDSEVINTRSFNNLTDNITWRLVNDLTQDSISPGTHNLELVITNYNSGLIEVDCFAGWDIRLNKTVDNTVDTDDFTLSGPELYTARQIETNEVTSKYNLRTVRIDANELNGETINQISISTDGGATFDSQSGSNDVTFGTSPTLDATPRLKLGGYTEDNTTSPTTGDAGHQIDRLRVLGDLTDLSVIDRLELTGSHFENLQRLHEYGNFLFTIEHSDAAIGNLNVTSYQEGDETRSAPDAYDDPVELRSEVDTTNYHNKVFVRGAVDSDSTPTATNEDTAEINDVGKTIELTVKAPEITTQAGAQFLATQLLTELTDENSRKGKITIPLQDPIINPGFARPIDLGDGTQPKTIENVILRHSTNQLVQEHEFSPPENVAERIEQLRRDTRNINTQV